MADNSTPGQHPKEDADNQFSANYPYYAPQVEDDNPLDLRDYFGVILHRKYWFLAGFLFVLVIGYITNSNVTPRYQSHSKLRLIAMGQGMDPFFGYDYISNPVITTHIENLKFSKFLKHVISELDTNLSVGRLSSLFTVSRSKEANIIHIEVITPDPDFTLKLSNVISKTYERYDLAIKQKSFKKYESKILDQLKIKQAKLLDIERRIQKFYENNPVIYDIKQRSATIQEYETEIDQNDLKLKELDSRRLLLSKEIAGLDTVVTQKVSHEETIDEKLLEMTMQLTELSTRYQPGHPKILQLKKKINAIKKMVRDDTKYSPITKVIDNPKLAEYMEILNEIRMEKEMLLTRRQELHKLQEKYFSHYNLTPEIELKLSRLLRSKTSAENIYFTLKEQLQQAWLNRTSTPQEVFVADSDTKAQLIPPRNLSGQVIVIISLCVGICLCFVVEYMDNSVKRTKDITERFGLKTLAIIPRKKQKINSSDIRSDKMLMSTHFEPYRRLLSNLNPMSSSNTNKDTLVTSALQNEGKSTTAIFLAITAALRGDKVLLVDADLRKGNIGKYFGFDEEIGLSTYLDGKCGFDDIVKPTLIQGLSVVCAGDNINSLAKTSTKDMLKKLIEKSHEEHTFVVFDSPPILQLSDTLILAQLVSRTLLVFRSAQTPKRAGDAVMEQLNFIDAHVTGSVLNDVSNSWWDQYYYQYYKYYKYGHYYS